MKRQQDDLSFEQVGETHFWPFFHCIGWSQRKTQIYCIERVQSNTNPVSEFIFPSLY